MKSYVKARRLNVCVTVLLLIMLHSQHVNSLPPDFFRFGFVLHEVCNNCLYANTFIKLFVLKYFDNAT